MWIITIVAVMAGIISLVTPVNLKNRFPVLPDGDYKFLGANINGLDPINLYHLGMADNEPKTSLGVLKEASMDDVIFFSKELFGDWTTQGVLSKKETWDGMTVLFGEFYQDSRDGKPILSSTKLKWDTRPAVNVYVIRDKDGKFYQTKS